MIKLDTNPTLLDFIRVCDGLRADERVQIEASSGVPYDFEHVAATCYGLPGPKWICHDGGVPVAIIGYIMQRPGVWRDWMLSTDPAWKQPIAMTRYCRFIMKSMIDAGAHRLECVSLANRPEAHKWYRSVGLKFEGILRAWGTKGEDAMSFIRLRGE